jgi:hypothetical protein
MAEITVPFSRKGITDAKKFLLDYKKNVLQQKLKVFVERLAQEGVEIAKENITTLDAIFTGELLNSVRAESGVLTKDTAIFYVVADSEHAAFVEFGTGQRGLEAPYPYPFPEGVEWNYNTGDKIQQAKEDIYVKDYSEPYIRKGDYFWVYIGEDGKLHISKGMPSRPFMYETAVELMTEIAKTAKEVFG